MTRVTSAQLRKLLLRPLQKIEQEAAQIASPLIWLFSNAPTQVLNAITAFMVGLVVLFVFHSFLICAGIMDLHGFFVSTLGVPQ